MAVSKPVQWTIRVQGKVQGVWFRKHVRDEAQRLGVHGWVRNEPDGSVTVLAEGPAVSVELLTAWCQMGPSGAKVSSVDWVEGPPAGLAGFVILR